MSYSSDIRIKNNLKKIHSEILKELKVSNLRLRIFDDSNEDDKLYEDGGLRFSKKIDTSDSLTYGSNDCMWYTVDDKGNIIPLLVVEASYGTERGQFGDGQLTRFSHGLGASVNGITAAIFMPFEGEYYSDAGEVMEVSEADSKIKYSLAEMRTDLIKACLNVGKHKNCADYFIIDAYDWSTLKNLVISLYKHKGYDKIKLDIEAKMTKHMGSDPTESDNHCIDIGKYFLYLSTTDYDGFTTPEKRSGHRFLGKNLTLHYIYNKKVINFMLRINKKELSDISNRPKSVIEVGHLLKDKESFQIFCNDDLFKIIKDISLIDKLVLFTKKKTRLGKNEKELTELREYILNHKKDFVDFIDSHPN